MTDEAVSSWRFDIHKCILRNCERLVELCVVKLHDDWFPLLDLLAMVLNPANKFHLYNGSRPSEFNLKQYIAQQSEQKVQGDKSDTGDGVNENIGKNRWYLNVIYKRVNPKLFLNILTHCDNSD